MVYLWYENWGKTWAEDTPDGLNVNTSQTPENLQDVDGRFRGHGALK